MARYNSVKQYDSTSGTTTIEAPNEGLVITFTGSAPYTVTLPSPVLYKGIIQNFYNASTGSITIASPSGNVKGPGFSTATSQTMPQHATYALTSDGTDYIIINNEGGPQLSSSLTVSGTINAQGTVSLSPSAANVTISPTGSGTVTIAPAAGGNINNMTVGGSTRAPGYFTVLQANNTVTFTSTVNLNGTVSGTGTIDGGTF